MTKALKDKQWQKPQDKIYLDIKTPFLIPLLDLPLKDKSNIMVLSGDIAQW